MRRVLLKKPVLASAVLLALSSVALGATVKGRLTDDLGKPLAGAQVSVPALQKGGVTAADGSYSLDVPDGNYVLQFKLADYGTVNRSVSVAATGATLDVVLKQNVIEVAPITITATAQPAAALTTPASVSVVQGRALEKQAKQSVMSAIQDEPGVNMIGEGPTVVKPEIRGLNSQDIVVVQDGIRNEVLQWGNEHAPEIDPMSTDRIEVMRGANSLLYGSDALGGVISVSHPELPNAKLGAGPLAGRVTADAQSVNNSVGTGALLSGAQGDWGWRANLSQRQSGNYMTATQGVVPNTGEQEVAGDGELGVRKDWGNLSFEYGRFNKRVELQNGFVYPTPLADDEYQVLGHDKGSVHANILTDLARVELIAGYDRANRNEYDHQSNLDPNGSLITDAPSNGEIPHLHWIQSNFTGDVKAHLAPMGPFNGTVGVQGSRRIEQSIGETHLTPGYNENSIGEYLFEEVPLDRFTFTFGVRSDQTHYAVGADSLIGIDPDNGLDYRTATGSPVTTPTVGKQSLNYTALSGAIGAVYHVTDPLAFAVNFGRGYRNPIPFELFAYGVHEGTGQFLIGNPNLQPETSWDSDASVRWSSDRIKAEVGVFRNYIHNYIYSTYTNLFYDGANNFTTANGAGFLPVARSAQANATIQGADFVVTGAATDWLTLKGGGNLVRGYNDNTSDATLPNYNLPHVPADNLRVGAEVHEKQLGTMSNPYFGVESKMYRPQRRTGPEEIATPGYMLLNLTTGTEFVVMNNRLSVDAGVDNLLNKGYIDFNSILKEFNIENPGRNVYVKVTVPFGS